MRAWQNKAKHFHGIFRRCWCPALEAPGTKQNCKMLQFRLLHSLIFHEATASRSKAMKLRCCDGMGVSPSPFTERATYHAPRVLTAAAGARHGRTQQSNTQKHGSVYWRHCKRCTPFDPRAACDDARDSESKSLCNSCEGSSSESVCNSFEGTCHAMPNFTYGCYVVDGRLMTARPNTASRRAR